MGKSKLKNGDLLKTNFYIEWVGVETTFFHKGRIYLAEYKFKCGNTCKTRECGFAAYRIKGDNSLYNPNDPYAGRCGWAVKEIKNMKDLSLDLILGL